MQPHCWATGGQAAAICFAITCFAALSWARLRQQWYCFRVWPMPGLSQRRVELSDDSRLQPTSHIIIINQYLTLVCVGNLRKSVCSPLSTFVASNRISSVSLVAFVLSAVILCVYCRARPADVKEEQHLNVWCCPSAWEAAIFVPYSYLTKSCYHVRYANST